MGPNSLDATERALAALEPLGFDIDTMPGAVIGVHGFEVGLERFLDGWEANLPV